MASVLLPIAKGFEELEAVALIDVMRRGGIEVRVVYLEDELQGDLVLGANGMPFSPCYNRPIYLSLPPT